ncbi:MAG: peptidylprolyl isomerase [Pseudomonadota bacterium]
MSEQNASAQQVELITNGGVIMVELFPGKAPKTVANFLQFVKHGYYSEKIIHRVVMGVLDQSGLVNHKFQRGKTRPPIRSEADNGLKNVAGTIAMSRGQCPHSAASEFFINVADNAVLDFRDKTPNGWGYAVFGKVAAGIDLVKRISAIPTTRRGNCRELPAQSVIIFRAIRIK